MNTTYVPGSWEGQKTALEHLGMGLMDGCGPSCEFWVPNPGLSGRAASALDP